MNPCVRLLICIFFACQLAVHAAPASQNRRFQFQEGGNRKFLLETNTASNLVADDAKNSWIKGHSEDSPDQEVEISSRIALRLRPAKNISTILDGSGAEILQQLNDDTFILQAADPLTAANGAERLAQHPDVAECIPVMRRLNLQPNSSYAYKPNDPLFANQFQLEQRDGGGSVTGANLNVRAAWPTNQGGGVTIGVADFAVDVAHPDLVVRANSSLHFNFVTGGTNLTFSANDTHATRVTGLAVATLNNNIGITGVAPSARFASWRIFSTNSAVTSDDQLANMFQYKSNNVAVQNHSWGSTSRSLSPRGMLSDAAIENAVKNGRQGRGVVMIRSSGNYRTESYSNAFYMPFNGNANDDGYNADPRVIVVGGVRPTGRVTYYSSPGACILVAALATESQLSDTGSTSGSYPALLTTSTNAFYENIGPGTSFSAPQIAGVCSLILSANTNLTYRDVQQLLIFASRHFDLADPDISTNGAGLLVSHNVGFGIPDAGLAVRLAKMWSNRPTMTKVTLTNTTPKTIPDQGFLVRCTGTGVPINLTNMAGIMATEERHPDLAPGEKLRQDSPTASLALVNVGPATNTITQNLTNKGALILRGGDSFYNKIKRAEQAGASFAIIYNAPANGDTLAPWVITNFVGIPSILIGQTMGTNLTNMVATNVNVRAQLRIDPATYTFNLTNKLICEHVGVFVRTDNLRRSDIRITLTSPQGTRSILQRVNKDPSTNAAIDWTYISTHHFFEASAGTWTVQLSDELSGGAIGLVQEVQLQVYGTTIKDTDNDGLDDDWETQKLGSLSYVAKDDPDLDGFSNMAEQIIGLNPNISDTPTQLDFSKWDSSSARISWPASSNYSYSVYIGTTLTNFAMATNIVGQFPDLEFFGSYTNGNEFIKVTATPR